MLELNPGLTIWTIVTFLALLAILRAVAWKPIIGALTARETAIRESLERADHARQEAERIIAEHSVKLARADEEARRILIDAREGAERLKDEIATKARQEGERMLEFANAEIERSRKAAQQQLQAEVANLAIHAAERILNETLDAARQKSLSDRIISELPKN